MARFGGERGDHVCGLWCAAECAVAAEVSKGDQDRPLPGEPNRDSKRPRQRIAYLSDRPEHDGAGKRQRTLRPAAEDVDPGSVGDGFSLPPTAERDGNQRSLDRVSLPRTSRRFDSAQSGDPFRLKGPAPYLQAARTPANIAAVAPSGWLRLRREERIPRMAWIKSRGVVEIRASVAGVKLRGSETG